MSYVWVKLLKKRKRKKCIKDICLILPSSSLIHPFSILPSSHHSPPPSLFLHVFLWPQKWARPPRFSLHLLALFLLSWENPALWFLFQSLSNLYLRFWQLSAHVANCPPIFPCGCLPLHLPGTTLILPFPFLPTPDRSPSCPSPMDDMTFFRLPALENWSLSWDASSLICSCW